jgi:hypothetical protein
MIGEPKEALRWLEIAYSEGSGYGLVNFRSSIDFYFGGMREDPDFQKFVNRIEIK